MLQISGNCDILCSHTHSSAIAISKAESKKHELLKEKTVEDATVARVPARQQRKYLETPEVSETRLQQEGGVSGIESG